MAMIPSKGAGGGLTMQSPVDRPDRVPLKKGEYSVASRAVALGSYFLSGALAINLSQFLGTPLYLVNEDWYNAWIAFTKQSFGLLTMSLTQAFAPTKVIVSGDASVRGQLRKAADGNLILDFPSRLILIANHQIYTDWLYLWWMAYCNGMHGRLYIILKESLKKIPVIGWGMQLSQFIFLKRNWEQDRPHMASALQKLNKSADPMWLLLFPEGTNLAPSTREKSKAWAQKAGMADMHHLLLPRTTGLQFCIEELKDTVGYLYDCTVAYEGVPRGQFAQDIFTLRAGYLEGRPPKSVSMHWRRFAIKDIPFKNQKAFELWTIARWREKDVLIEKYLRDGKFPADTGATKFKSGEIKQGSGHLEVQIRSSHWYEFLQIFAPMGVLAMVLAVFYGAIPETFWKSFNKQALQSKTEDIKKAGVQAGTQGKAIAKTTAGLTLDDIFDQDKQEQSFKKGAMAVQQFLQTPQAASLLNKVDFATSFLQDPQKTVTQNIAGQRKDFMKSIKEEEARRNRLRIPVSKQNVGEQRGTFWNDLNKLEKSRNGSVITTASSKPAGTFWADLEAAERKKGGLGYDARGTFWDKMKSEENSRYGTVRTLSSNASTAVGSVQSMSSRSPSMRKMPSIAESLERRPSAPSVISARSGVKPAKLAPAKQTPKPPANATASKQVTPVSSTKPSKPVAAGTKLNAAAKPSPSPVKSTTPPKPQPKTSASAPKTANQIVKKPTAVNASAKPKPVANGIANGTATKPSQANKPVPKPQAVTTPTKNAANEPTKLQTKSTNKQPPPKLKAASSGPTKLPAKPKV